MIGLLLAVIAALIALGILLNLIAAVWLAVAVLLLALAFIFGNWRAVGPGIRFR